MSGQEKQLGSSMGCHFKHEKKKQKKTKTKKLLFFSSQNLAAPKILQVSIESDGQTRQMCENKL